MNAMNYKIYVETDSCFSICIGQFEMFEEAQEQMERMIVDLISKPKKCVLGDWGEFKEEFPEKIQMILDNYEEEGAAYFAEDIEDDTDNYHYVINGNVFEVCDNEDFGNEPSFAISTNTLGIDGLEREYYFRLWQDCGMSEESLVIRLVAEPNDLDDEEEHGCGSVEVYNRIPDDVRSRLGVLDYEDEEDL